MSSIPFYGGLNGLSFAIKEVFNNRAELVSDLNAGWKSPISVGEYVAISYGAPGGDPYKANWKDADKDNGVNYNSTIWLKVYAEDLTTDPKFDNKENVVNSNGLGYKLLFFTTGDMPQLLLVAGTTVAVASNPEITLDESASSVPDVYVYQVHMPRAQRILIVNTAPSDVGTDPEIEDDADDVPDIVTLTFTLPRSQNIQEEVDITKLAVDTVNDEDPRAILNKADPTIGATVNEPRLQMWLPAILKFLARNVSREVIAAADPPSVLQSYAEGDTLHEFPRLLFSLPQAQVMREGETDLKLIKPSDPPKAETRYTDGTTKNEPYLYLELPRAVNFFHGTRLSAAQDYTGLSLADFTGMLDEDFYINDTLGFIFKATNVDTEAGTLDLTYWACIQAPLPTINQGDISAYKEDGSTNEVSILRVVAPDLSSWLLDISVPQSPVADENFEFIGAEEDGDVTIYTDRAHTEDTNDNTLQFAFKIPRGSRFFVGTTVNDNALSTIVEGAKKGDYYINNSGNTSSAGHVYKWNGSTWERQDGYGLQGPTGKALNIIAERTITPTEVANDTLEDVGSYLSGLGLNPDPDELVSVVYQDTDSVGYWYYKPGSREDTTRQWARTKLTGSLSAFTIDTYSVDADKVYNTIYINGLLKGAFGASDNKDRLTYNATAVDSLVLTLENKISALETALLSAVATLNETISALESKVDRDIEEQKSWGKISDLEDYDDGE